MRNRVEEYRERLGWTQIQLAERMKVAQGTISRIENGVQCPSVELAFKLEKLFRVDIHELFMYE